MITYTVMMTTASDTVLPLLRKATAALHKQLDDNLPLAAPHPSIEDYSQHLLGFRNWLADIGVIIESSSFASDEFAGTHSLLLKLLERDLQAMNVEVSTSVPNHEASTRLNAAYCIGVEYVVTGSALGSAMLYQKASQLFPAAPMAFMQDSKLHGKARWKTFIEKLASYHWSENDLVSAQLGAVWAFQRFIQLHELSLNIHD